MKQNYEQSLKKYVMMEMILICVFFYLTIITCNEKRKIKPEMNYVIMIVKLRYEAENMSPQKRSQNHTKN